jgi:hypothetical protein
MLEDRELLRQYAEERNEDAFRTLVDRHIQFVYSAARRRLNFSHFHETFGLVAAEVRGRG